MAKYRGLSQAFLDLYILQARQVGMQSIET
jgi:hypothetical protein